MPSLFEISVAAFAMSVAANAPAPNTVRTPENLPHAQIIVDDGTVVPVVPQKTADAIPVPTPRPEHDPEDDRDCFTLRGVVTTTCPPAPVKTAAQ